MALDPHLDALAEIVAELVAREILAGAELEGEHEVSQPARANRGRLGRREMSKEDFDDEHDIANGAPAPSSRR
jgi:hypothetical protein